MIKDGEDYHELQTSHSIRLSFWKKNKQQNASTNEVLTDNFGMTVLLSRPRRDQWGI